MSQDYEFLHGRDWLAGLLGIPVGLVVGIIAVVAAFLMEPELIALGIIDNYLDEMGILLTFIVPFFAAIGVLYFFPPKMVNVKCTGKIYPDRMEIQMGNKLRTLKYSEIALTRKVTRRGLMTWYIDSIFICDAVGMLVNDKENRATIDEFVGAVEERRTDYVNRRM